MLFSVNGYNPNNPNNSTNNVVLIFGYSLGATINLDRPDLLKNYGMRVGVDFELGLAGDRVGRFSVLVAVFC